MPPRLIAPPYEPQILQAPSLGKGAPEHQIERHVRGSVGLGRDEFSAVSRGQGLPDTGLRQIHLDALAVLRRNRGVPGERA